MTLKELAAYLQLNERTVLKLASAGQIPSVRIARQWRFKRENIENWLDDMMESGKSIEEPSEEAPEIVLGEVCDPKGIMVNFTPTSRKEVIDKMVGLLSNLGVVRDKSALARGFIEREKMMSTAMPGGTAVLHCRTVPAKAVTQPGLALATCHSSFQFGASDCDATRIFFALAAPSNRVHLALMSAIAPLMRSSELADTLAAINSPEEAYKTITEYLPD